MGSESSLAAASTILNLGDNCAANVDPYPDTDYIEPTNTQELSTVPKNKMVTLNKNEKSYLTIVMQ